MSTNPADTIAPIGKPLWAAWRESTLTRAKELEALAAWVRSQRTSEHDAVLETAIDRHLRAAREAATVRPMRPRVGSLMERALSNLDAAEAHILNIAPPEYVLGQLACLVRHVRCHLPESDPGRRNFERIARGLGVDDVQQPPATATRFRRADKLAEEERARRLRTIDNVRGSIVTTVRAASSACLREIIRLRSFRNVVVVSTAFMTLLAISVALLGFLQKDLIPMCFAPEEAGVVVIACPTGQSERFVPTQNDGAPPEGVDKKDIDTEIAATTHTQDLLIVELVGLAAAAVATAAAIRRIKGSSERFGLPVALAVLKLPTGALTAFLGLLLMRGQFVPGLSALDNSAQILAWALVFGYAQQLFTRLVDQQGQTVLDSVRAPT